MAEVELTIAGRTYRVACRAGEEDNLRAAGALVDAKSREALAGLGTLVRIAPIAVRRAAARRPDRRRARRSTCRPAPTPSWSNAPPASPSGSNRSPTPLRASDRSA